MKTQYKLMMALIAMCVCMLTMTALAQNLTENNAGPVCSNNDYALCSHAACQCLDDDGNPGECKEYQGTDAGWAVCDCPVVKTGNTGENVAYDANFATLDCQERANPTSAGTAFPTYVETTAPKIYSTYSFGDSLNNGLYGTLNDASLMVCDSPDMMTLCLDMPCRIDESGRAICYCQNVSINPNNPNSVCPGGGWNTLGGNCEQGNCDPGKNKIWSAACIDQTLVGIADNTVYIRYNLDNDFTDMPKYCSN